MELNWGCRVLRGSTGGKKVWPAMKTCGVARECRKKTGPCGWPATGLRVRLGELEMENRREGGCPAKNSGLAWPVDAQVESASRCKLEIVYWDEG